jgi:hypothetical protein
MSKTVLIVGAMTSAMVLACVVVGLTATPGVGKPRTVTLVGAGDIAGCDFKPDRKTARLLGKIPGTVFTLGDHAYPWGTAQTYEECYDPTWGRSRSAPSPSPATTTTTGKGQRGTSTTSARGQEAQARATTPTSGGTGT